jgi:hypothetical protein
MPKNREKFKREKTFEEENKSGVISGPSTETSESLSFVLFKIKFHF